MPEADNEAQSLSDEEKAEVQDDKIRSKKFYIGMIFISIIVALIFKWQLIAVGLEDVYSFQSCNGTVACLNNQATYRISFGSFLFFLIMGIATYVPSTDSDAIHLDWWCIKLVGFPALIALGFLIPNGFFDVYAEIARVVSGLFLLLQVIILIDFAHDLHEILTHANEEDGGMENMTGGERALYLGFAFSCVLVSIIGSILLYVFYPPCTQNTAFITLSLVVGLVLFCISLSEKVDVGILPPAVVFLYGVWLTFTALMSIPGEDCNLPESSGWFQLILSTIVTIFSVTYVSGQTAAKAPGVLSGGPCCKQDEEAAPRPLYWFFHWTLSLASLYVAMMLTNWGVQNDDGSVSQRSWTNVWIKLVPGWVTYLLFFWTLVAPICCPDRDFSDNNNRFEKK